MGIPDVNIDAGSKCMSALACERRGCLLSKRWSLFLKNTGLEKSSVTYFLCVMIKSTSLSFII